jgi:pimeloyl-ACP methyl ester carboxylesterase
MVPVSKLVLLPGMDGTGELFLPLIEALPRQFETQIVRYPGNEPHSYTALAHFVESSASSTTPFILVAESFSTPLAIEWAATNPPNLKGLALCAGFASSPVSGPLRFAVSCLAPLLFLANPSSMVMQLLLLGPNAPIETIAAVQSAISSVKPSVLAERLRNVLQCDVRRAMKRVTVPILLVNPGEDKLVGKAKLDEMRRIAPSATVETIRGPHLLFQREPLKSAEVIAAFASRCLLSHVVP